MESNHHNIFSLFSLIFCLIYICYCYYYYYVLLEKRLWWWIITWTCLLFSWTERHQITKNREKLKPNFQWIPCRSSSMSWHKVIPNNNHRFSFVLYIQLIWFCIMITFFETLEKDNNNNKHGEKPNKKWGKRGCGGGISTLKMFMIFMNRKT